jgi:hypothetical protein
VGRKVCITLERKKLARHPVVREMEIEICGWAGE